MASVRSFMRHAYIIRPIYQKLKSLKCSLLKFFCKSSLKTGSGPECSKIAKGKRILL